MFAISDNNTDLFYKIELIEENDSEKVVDFIKSFFFPSEPLLKCVVCEGNHLDVEWYLNIIKGKCSFKAVSKSNGEIIGVRLNKLEMRGTNRKSFSDSDEGIDKISKLLEFVEGKTDIFQNYADIDKYLEGKMLCVNTEYRGLGISQNLLKRSFDFMLENNCGLFRVVCTSFYSQRIAEKMEFREIYRLNYTDYKNEENQPVFSPEEPHTAVVVFIKMLSELKARNFV